MNWSDPTHVAWSTWGGVKPSDVFYVSPKFRPFFALYLKQHDGVRVLGKTVKLRRRRWVVSS